MNRVISFSSIKQKIKLLLFFILILVNSTLAQAQTPLTQEYKSDDYKFEVAFPPTWNLTERQINPTCFSLTARSPERFPVISILSAPHKEADKKNNQVEKTQKVKTSSPAVDGQGEIMLSGKKVKWVLSSTYFLSMHVYTLFCYIPTDHHDYVISMQGIYENYENDRKIFDDIIETFKIIP